MKTSALRMVLVLVAFLCTACGSTWSHEGTTWKHKSGIQLSQPEGFPDGSASGSTLTFTLPDSKLTYYRLTAFSNRAESEALAHKRLDAIKNEENRISFGEADFKSCHETLGSKKQETNFWTADHCSIKLGYRGEGAKWVCYEMSYLDKANSTTKALVDSLATLKF